MIQPDVEEFMRTWLLRERDGTDLHDIPVIATDDPGNVNPPYIFLEEAGFVRLPGVPFYEPYRMSLTAFGRTKREAKAIYRAATDLIHNARDQYDVNGVGFAWAEDETGPQPGPEGRWPARSGVMDLFMPDRALTLGS